VEACHERLVQCSCTDTRQWEARLSCHATLFIEPAI
jgi:hypothetical protein